MPGALQALGISGALGTGASALAGGVEGPCPTCEGRVRLGPSTALFRGAPNHPPPSPGHPAGERQGSMGYWE